MGDPKDPRSGRLASSVAAIYEAARAATGLPELTSRALASPDPEPDIDADPEVEIEVDVERELEAAWSRLRARPPEPHVDHDEVTNELALDDAAAHTPHAAAQSFCERLTRRAELFRGRMGADRELGVRLSPVFGEPLYVDGFAYDGTDMIVFRLSTKLGTPIEVMQHVSQANVWFVPVPCRDLKDLPASEPPAHQAVRSPAPPPRVAADVTPPRPVAVDPPPRPEPRPQPHASERALERTDSWTCVTAHGRAAGT
jgi:hypothetical protein